MAGFRQLNSMALSDDEQLDWLRDRGAWPRAAANDLEPPEYPSGLQFTVREPDFAALGIAECKPGDTVRFAAFARATSVGRHIGGCRVEAEIDMLSLDGGEMAELDDACRPCLSFDENDHDRLDLDDGGCEQGNMLHLIGSARVEATDDNQWAGKCLTLQIIEMAVEDEDQEAEEATA